MRKKRQSGVSLMEFTFSLLVLVPLLLGTTAVGINMILSLQTVQLARDSGHMYANGVDFSQPGNKTILTDLGSTLGLTTSSGSNAVVVLSTVEYVDKNVCSGFGLVDTNGNPSGCTNYQSWVFTQRLVIGNSALHSSNLGSPIVTGTSPVTLDATTGKVSPASQEATNPGDVAIFTGLNPFVVAGNLDQLPTGQVIYVAEAAATGFTMKPFTPNSTMYSYTMF